MLLSKEYLRKKQIINLNQIVDDRPAQDYQTILRPDTRNSMDDAMISVFNTLSNYHEQRLENQKLLLTEAKNIKKFADDSGSSAKGVISSMMQIVDNFYDRIRGLFMDDIDYVLANSEYVMKFNNSDSFTMEDIYRYSINKVSPNQSRRYLSHRLFLKRISKNSRKRLRKIRSARLRR